jgi:small-conductance mechanosensitive channel
MKSLQCFLFISLLTVSSCSVVKKNGYYQSRKYKPKTKSSLQLYKKANRTNKSTDFSKPNKTAYSKLAQDHSIVRNQEYTRKVANESNSLSVKQSNQPAITKPTNGYSTFYKSSNLENRTITLYKKKTSSLQLTVQPKSVESHKKHPTKLAVAITLLLIGLTVVLFDFTIMWPFLAIGLLGLALLLVGYTLLRLNHFSSKSYRTMLSKNKKLQLTGELIGLIGVYLIVFDFMFLMYGTVLIFGIPVLALGIFLMLFGMAKSSNRRKRRNRNNSNRYFKSSAILFALSLILFFVSFGLYYFGLITLVLSGLCLLASLITIIIGFTK